MKQFSIFAFALATLFLLMVLLRFTSFQQSQDGYFLETYFENAGGIRKDAPVMIAGYEIGKVQQIELDHVQRGVKMQILIFDDVKIPRDSTLKIAEKGMLGEMYLSFKFGTSKQMYQPGELVEGDSPTNLTEFVGSAGEVFTSVGSEIQGLAHSLNQVFSEKEVQKDLKTAINDFSKLLSNANQILSENKESFKMSNEKLTQIMVNADAIVSSLKEKESFKNLANILSHLEEVVKGIKPLIAESKKGAESLNEVTGKAKEVMEHIVKLLEALNVSKGTGGKLVYDASLYDNMNKLLKDGSELLTFLKANPSAIIFGKKKKVKISEQKMNARKRKGMNEYTLEVE